MEMFKSGNVMAMDESRMFCERFIEVDSDIPMLENVVL